MIEVALLQREVVDDPPPSFAERPQCFVGPPLALHPHHRLGRSAGDHAPVVGHPEHEGAPCSEGETLDRVEPAGLAALADLDEGVPRWNAVAAYLHERNGDLESAARLYAEAAVDATNVPERNHLNRQAARVNQILRDR